MRNIIVLLLYGLCLLSCDEKATIPKPRGLYRIEIPEARYMEFTSEELPYAFVVSQFVSVELPPLNTSVDWINLSYESLNAKIYCGYQRMTKEQLRVLDEECRDLVARSVKVADGIHEQVFENPEAEVYGTLFLVEGETPSPVQFMLTDSVRHFFRGALYYQCTPDIDSLAPVTEYLRHDIIELIQTFRWK